MFNCFAMPVAGCCAVAARVGAAPAVLASEAQNLAAADLLETQELISERMGHSQLATIFGHYQNASKERLREAGDEIGAYYEAL